MPRGHDDDPGGARATERLLVSGGHVHGVGVGDAIPGEGVRTPRLEARTESQDRALPARIDETDRLPWSTVALVAAWTCTAVCDELLPRPLRNVVVPERDEEVA